MRRAFLLGAGLVVSAAGSAIAADLPVKARPMVPVVTVYNWSGCYVGGNVGGKWARTSGSVDIGPGTGAAGATAASSFPLGSTTSGTLIGGGQVGCNWQAAGSNWVFGIEGDADAQRWSASRTAAGALPTFFVPGDMFDVRSTWEASARGRIGYAWDRLLVYATGGVGFTNVRVGTNFIAVTTGGVSFPATVLSDSRTVAGPTVGGGFEYAFTNNWSFGLEGRYTWYGTKTFNAGAVATQGLPPAGPFTFAAATQSVKLDTFEVMGKLNWKFDWGGPVVARY